MAADTRTPEMRVCITTLDAHLADAFERAKQGLNSIPGLHVSMHIAADFGTDPQAAERARQDIAKEALKRGGVVVKPLDEAIEYANEVAAEHVQLAVQDPDDVMRRIRHGGSFFLGHEAAEAFGDYIAGPNHILPTSGTARFSSGLSVDDFYRRQTFLQLHDFDEQIAQAAIRIARQEQLEGHARAMAVRLEDV